MRRGGCYPWRRPVRGIPLVERGPEVTARRIVQAPEAVLRRKARRVRDVDARVRALAQDLIDSLPPNGVGLAAPQIGVSLQVAIVKLPEDEAPTVLVNPKVVRRQGEREIGEGCLSLEGYEGVVTRSSKVASGRPTSMATRYASRPRTTCWRRRWSTR